MGIRRAGLLFQGVHVLLGIQLRGQFLLAEVLQPVRRLMHQRSNECHIAAMDVTAEADAIACRSVKALQSILAVIQQQHPCSACALHLGDQG